MCARTTCPTNVGMLVQEYSFPTFNNNSSLYKTDVISTNANPFYLFVSLQIADAFMIEVWRPVWEQLDKLAALRCWIMQFSNTLLPPATATADGPQAGDPTPAPTLVSYCKQI